MKPGAGVALLSGGLDSGTALALWLAEGGRIALCLTADYGQRAAAAELTASRGLAQRFELPWQAVELPWLAEVSRRSGSALVARDRELPAGTLDAPGGTASAAAVWVPARNLVLLAVAAAYAEVCGADAIVAGFNREEAATFADNSEAFVDALNTALRFATRSPVRVVSPTLALDKPAIAAAARRLGLGTEDFYSCYEGGVEPCGRCESCLRSRRAWGGCG